jgi:hypothetical protein
MAESKPGTTIHRKPNGAAYLYSFESYWDKGKKAARNRQVCLGRYNEETGELIPSKRRKEKTESEGAGAGAGFKATTKVYGPYLLLSRLAEETGLAGMLETCMPDISDEILSLVFFIVQKGVALSRCNLWSASHQHPYGQPIGSQQVSDLLRKITEDSRQHFLSLWMGRLLENEFLCYDITSVSSYATANEYVRLGYNRDKEKLPQINLAMLYGQKSGLPAYYRRLQGAITDVATLDTTIDTLDFLGKKKLHLVLDRGFYSEDNLDTLFEKRYRFILMARTDRVWVREIIDQYCEQVSSPDHYRQIGEDEVLYMVAHLFKWKGHRCYAHLYYNATKAAEDFDKLNKKLVICKGELEADEPVGERKLLYERFFIVKRTPKRGLSVSYNNDEIQKYRKRYAGFFCILTNVKTDSGELLEIYRRKDVVENCFDDLKNGLDMKRLRIHSSPAMDARLFIQFLALILISKIRSEVRGDKALKYLSPREVMEAMESIVRITCVDKPWSIYSETSPIQQKIVDLFDIATET